MLEILFLEVIVNVLKYEYLIRYIRFWKKKKLIELIEFS